MYITRDSEGKISGLSLSPTEFSEPADPNDEELRAFLSSANPKLSASDQLEGLDSASVRVIEDLIDVLVDRGTILFTDLPVQAQKRLLERKLLRKIVRKEKGLPDEDSGFLLSDDKIF